MEFNHQERKYTAPEKLFGLECLSAAPTAIERDIENALGRNSHDHKHDCSAPLTEFLGEKTGQFVEALLEVVLRSCLEINGLKIGAFHRVKRWHEAIFPCLVEGTN
jgi:hypothetical protein